MPTPGKVEMHSISRAKLFAVHLSTAWPPLPGVWRHPEWGTPNPVALLYGKVVVQRYEIVHGDFTLGRFRNEALCLAPLDSYVD